VDRPTILFATHNPGKLVEMRALLEPLGLECVGADAAGLSVPEETGATFAANAAIKAHAASGALDGAPILADDSGLVVPALGGAPGVHTARFAAGGYGAAIDRLRLLLEALGPAADERAELVCALCLVTADGLAHAAESRREGRLVFPPRGEGPGFEPIFEPAGERRALAELDEHARIHAHPRAAAVAALAPALRATALSAPRSLRRFPGR
jgi:XTP/dITP diphosphohydrolase